MKRYIISKFWGSMFLGKYLSIFWYKFILSAVSIGWIIFSEVIFMKLKIIKKYFSKNYFPKELKDNSTQFRAIKTNRARMDHNLVLIFSYQLIRIIFTFCFVYFDAWGYSYLFCTRSRYYVSNPRPDSNSQGFYFWICN